MPDEDHVDIPADAVSIREISMTVGDGHFLDDAGVATIRRYVMTCGILPFGESGEATHRVTFVLDEVGLQMLRFACSEALATP